MSLVAAILRRHLSFRLPLPVLAVGAGLLYPEPSRRAPPSPIPSFRTEQADFFFHFRSYESVGLRREESLCSSIHPAFIPPGPLFEFAFVAATEFIPPAPNISGTRSGRRHLGLTSLARFGKDSVSKRRVFRPVLCRSLQAQPAGSLPRLQ